MENFRAVDDRLANLFERALLWRVEFTNGARKAARDEAALTATSLSILESDFDTLAASLQSSLLV